MSTPAEMFPKHVANVIAERSAQYGDASSNMAAIAQRWSATLGREVTAAQVVLCLLDLKLARLATALRLHARSPPSCGWSRR